MTDPALTAPAELIRAGTAQAPAGPSRRAVVAGSALGGTAYAAATGWTPMIIAMGVLGAAMGALAVVDACTRRLPNAIVYPCAAAGVPLVVAGHLWGGGGSLVTATASGLGVFAFLLAAMLASPRQLGGGDVKLGAVIAWHLGYFGFGAVAVTFLVAMAANALFGAVNRMRDRGSHSPLGPFLAAAACIALVMAS